MASSGAPLPLACSPSDTEKLTTLFDLAALLWYDFALTFNAEVPRIWHRKFSYVSFAYVCMRYSMLFDRVTLVLGILLWSIDNKVGYASHR